MALPKVDLPKYKHKLIGVGKEVTFRPFTLKEQKILLHAKQSEETEEKLDSMCQVIDLCTFGKIQAEELPIFDVEDLFLRIRIKSVSDVVKFKYNVLDENGEKTDEMINVQINLDEVKVEKKEEHTNIIMISDTVGIKMKYPTIKLIRNMDYDKKEYDEEIIMACIDSIFDENEVYTDFSKEELNEFMDQMESKHFAEIKRFFDTMPKLRYEKEIKLPGDRGTEILKFEGIDSFFG